MNTNFQILPFTEDVFAKFLQMTNDELATHQVVRQTVTKSPGFPCRFTLEDASIGEEVLLFHYQHHAVEGPYRASGAVYVRPGVSGFTPAVNQVPRMLKLRPQSIRGYDADGMMIAATMAEGPEVKRLLKEVFSNPLVTEIHLHNAKPGCFNCRAVRV